MDSIKLWMHPTKLSSTGLINISRLFVTILLFKVLLIVWYNCFIIVYIDYCLLFVKSDLILDDRLIQEIIIYCGLEHKSNAQETPTVKLFFLTYLVLIKQTLLLVCSLALHSPVYFSDVSCHVHELAVSQIHRYLEGANTKGFILHLSPTFSLRLLHGCQFTGLWSPTISSDSISVKSCID